MTAADESSKSEVECDLVSNNSSQPNLELLHDKSEQEEGRSGR